MPASHLLPLRPDARRIRASALSRRHRRARRQEICTDCWGLWLKQQTMLINHYGLNVMDPQARSFLTKNMEAFLFKKGGEEDVDTSKQGTIAW